MSDNLEAFKNSVEEKLAEYNKNILKINKKDILEIDEIIDNCISFGLTDLLIRYLIFKSAYLSLNNRQEEAQVVVEDAIALSKKYKSQRLLASSINRAGSNKWNFGLYDEALEYFLDSYKIFKDLELTEDTCLLLKNIGTTYLRKDDSHLAYKYLYDAYQMSIKYEFKYLEGVTLSWLGILENDLGNYEKSIENEIESNKILLDLKKYKEYSTNLNSIGLTYIRLKNYEKALDFLLEAEEYAEQYHNMYLLADIRHNQGLVFKGKGDLENAAIFYKKSISLRAKYGDPNKLSKSFQNLGNVYAIKKEYKRALRYYRKSLLIRKKAHLIKQTATNYISIANLYLAIEEYKRALYFGKKSLNIAVDYNDSRLLSAVYEFYADYYEKRNNFKRAVEFFNLKTAENDKMVNEDSKQNIMNMEKKYEIDLLQKQIQEENEQEQINASVAMAVTANHQINQPLMLLQGNIDLLKVLFSKKPALKSNVEHLNKIEFYIDEIDMVLKKFRENSGISMNTIPENLPVIKNKKS